MTNDFTPILQGAAAATMAWIIAKHLVRHHEPFFAPMAAFIGLNTTLAERGTNALRLVKGVLAGIVVGQLTVFFFGRSYATLALGILLATTLARALGGGRIVISNAATSAILCVAVMGAETSQNRLVDALIGVSVALGFSQFLFAPEPVVFVRRAMGEALHAMSTGLAETATALEQGDDELIELTTVQQRSLRERMNELHAARKAADPLARHSLVWSPDAPPLTRERRSAEHLDHLGGSCLVLMRLARATRPENRPRLAPVVRVLSILLEDLSLAAWDPVIRERVAHAALSVARQVVRTDAPPESTLSAAFTAARVVASDLMIFSGVAPRHVTDAVREGTLPRP